MTALACGCQMIFPLPAPRVADHVWCKRHHSTRVVAVGTEYRVKCRDCRYSRPFGAAELTAMTVASKHGLTKRHTVDVYCGGKHVHTVARTDTQLDFSGLDEPPF